MYQLTLKSIAEALGFSYEGKDDIVINEVVIDSRLVSPQSLFIAFKGKNVDGHQFIENAISMGALGIVCERLPETINPEVGYIIAEGRAFLEKLAYFMRSRFKGEVIAVTGSYGKTSTKDLLKDILSPYYKTIVTYENQNNELGVPLTLSRLREDCEILILEMGMDGLGDIDYLAKLARPSKAIITSIGMVHAEHLGGKDKIAQAKSELIPYLEENAVLALRKQDEMFLLPYLKTYKGEVIWVGSDVFSCDVELTREQTRFTYAEKNLKYPITLPHLGAHYVENSLLAISIARHLGLSIEAISKALEKSIIHSSNRMEKISLKANSFLYNDSYNANPDSVKATLKVLALHKPMKTIAVLGDMYELGEYEESGHLEVGEAVYKENIDVLIAVGRFDEWIKKGAQNAGMGEEAIYCFDDLKEVANCIKEIFDSEIAILLKGSRGMKMELILDYIKDLIDEGGAC